MSLLSSLVCISPQPPKNRREREGGRGKKVLLPSLLFGLLPVAMATISLHLKVRRSRVCGWHEGMACMREKLGWDLYLEKNDLRFRHGQVVGMGGAEGVEVQKWSRAEMIRPIMVPSAVMRKRQRERESVSENVCICSSNVCVRACVFYLPCSGRMLTKR